MTMLNARTHIAMGLAFLVASSLLGASFLGLVPDRAGAMREGRTALTESLAMMFRPEMSATACSAARTSTFWKSNESFSPR